MSNKVRIGVVGFTTEKHDVVEGWKAVTKGFDTVLSGVAKNTEVEVVSSYVDHGVAQAAYYQAARAGWETVAVAPVVALNSRVFPVNRAVKAGKKWGDEAVKFVDNIDVLITVGRNDVSGAVAREAKKRGIPIHEYKVEAE